MSRIETAEALLDKTIMRASGAKGGGLGAIVITVRDLLALIRDYYDDHATGGQLHVLLDDGNVGDNTINWCREYLTDPDDACRGGQSPHRAAKLILELLAELTVEERQLLYDRGYGHVPDDVFLAIESPLPRPRPNVPPGLVTAEIGEPLPVDSALLGFEVAEVTCPNGHQVKVAASIRIPESERMTFCATCFAPFTAPLVSDVSKRVPW